MTRAAAIRTYWEASRNLSPRVPDPIARDMALANLRDIARHSPYPKLQRMARERLRKVATATEGFRIWGGAA